jgi:hypothetical protein
LRRRRGTSALRHQDGDEVPRIFLIYQWILVIK